MGHSARAMDGYTTTFTKNADQHLALLLLQEIARPICSNAGMTCRGFSRNCRTAGKIVGRNRPSPRLSNPGGLNMTVMVSRSVLLLIIFVSKSRPGDYRCKFIPSNDGGYPGQPCKGPLRSDFWHYPQGKVFNQPKQSGGFPPAELTISGPAVLEVSDHWCRVAQYEVTINGQSLGRTSNTLFDRRCRGDSKCWKNMDKCISQGFSHGFFQIPSGFQMVQINWVDGDFRGWPRNQGLYRVFDACPGRF